MIDDSGCPTCGRGRTFSSARFDHGDSQIHWTMWSCGHSTRTVVETSEDLWPTEFGQRAPLEARA